MAPRLLFECVLESRLAGFASVASCGYLTNVDRLSAGRQTIVPSYLSIAAQSFARSDSPLLLVKQPPAAWHISSRQMCDRQRWSED